LPKVKHYKESLWLHCAIPNSLVQRAKIVLAAHAVFAARLLLGFGRSTLWVGQICFLLVQSPDLEIQRRYLRLVVVLCAGLRDFGLGQVQLRLAQLDDGAESQIVAGLGEAD
jgi:hypothetical protein